MMRRLVLVTFAALVAAACSGPRATVGHRIGFRAFQLPEIKPGVHIAERFAIPAGRVSAIEFSPVRLGSVAGTIHFDVIVIAADGSRTERNADVAATDFTRQGTYRFAFTPVDARPGSSCYVELSSSAADPARGATVWADRGRLTDDGLVFNGRPRWARLAYRATIEPPPQPPVRTAVWFAVPALVISGAAMLRIVRELAWAR